MTKIKKIKIAECEVDADCPQSSQKCTAEYKCIGTYLRTYLLFHFYQTRVNSNLTAANKSEAWLLSFFVKTRVSIFMSKWEPSLHSHVGLIQTYTFWLTLTGTLCQSSGMMVVTGLSLSHLNPRLRWWFLKNCNFVNFRQFCLYGLICNRVQTYS